MIVKFRNFHTVFYLSPDKSIMTIAESCLSRTETLRASIGIHLLQIERAICARVALFAFNFRFAQTFCIFLKFTRCVNSYQHFGL